MTTRVSRLFALALAAAALSAPAGCTETDDGPPRPAAPATPPKLSGPYTHGNLSVFLVHGPDRIADKTFLTLDEALAQKKAVVHETKNVNELSIENVSADAEVFVQAGDIVKGGQQDRVLAIDLVVPPKSGKVPLAAFCVESGRWRARGGEASNYFSLSDSSYASNGQKVAVRAQASQQEVWKNVAKDQAALARNAGAEVRDPRSPSSLQLTLENKKLNESIDAAVKGLSAVPDKEADAIGCAVAINGKVIGADVYASSALFKKLWPKLLKAAAVEALAEEKKDAKFTAPTAEAVREFLTDAEKGKAKETAVSKRVNLLQKEGAKALLFESRDYANGSAALRQNYLANTLPQGTAPAPRGNRPPP
jgi:hypothetical protein